MESHISNLYQKEDNDEIITWGQDPRFEGFSVLKDYPLNCGFVPAQNTQGQSDTKAMIKVGFDITKVKQNKVGLHVTAVKFSKYLEKHFGYDFSDELCPSKDSLDISNKSPQPIDLEENERYILNISNKKIFDCQQNMDVTLNYVVDDFYKQHLATIAGIKANIFKFKVKAKFRIWKVIFDGSEKVSKLFVNINKIFFGKVVIKKDSFEGFFSPYKYENLVSVYPDVIPFFNSTFKISKITIFWVSLSILMVWWQVGKAHSSIRSMNETSTIALVILLVTLFDIIIPRTILFIANQFIKIRLWLGSVKFFMKTKW